jgi:hypothetical protein
MTLTFSEARVHDPPYEMNEIQRLVFHLDRTQDIGIGGFYFLNGVRILRVV